MEEILKGIKAGEERAVARAITLIENNPSERERLLQGLYPLARLPYLIGITGPPGSGKSTLSEKLIRAWRARGIRIGVIAVDPSSQSSGGVLLGDRIRMGDVAVDQGVFIRSMATRGALGGLNPVVFDTVLLLSAAGYDYILIETVGVGQNEIDIVNLANTTLIVTIPAAGDEIQSLKAGLMEIGDIFVINKADLAGADRMVLTLEQMTALEGATEESWLPPVLKTIATSGEGLPGLIEGIDRHYQYINKYGLLEEKRKVIIKKQLISLLEKRLKERVLEPLIGSAEFKRAISRMLNFEEDPYTLVEKLLQEKGV